VSETRKSSPNLLPLAEAAAAIEFVVGFTNAPAAFLMFCDANSESGSQIQFGVSDRTGCCSQLRYEILRTLKALANRPFWRFTAPGESKEFLTDLSEIVGEKVFRALAVIAVEDPNRKSQQIHFRIELGDGRLGDCFFEYCFQVPANRIGSYEFTTAQLKTIQEIIMLTVFAAFSVLYLGDKFKWNYAAGFACIVAGSFFIFQKW
jgi:hypothetical protein